MPLRKTAMTLSLFDAMADVMSSIIEAAGAATDAAPAQPAKLMPSRFMPSRFMVAAPLDAGDDLLPAVV